MQTAKKGDWVQIHQVILKPQERAPQVPDDTKLVPLELWVKGTLQHDAVTGDAVEIITATGRKVKGELVSVNPGYTHGYGKFVSELHIIDEQLKSVMREGAEL